MDKNQYLKLKSRLGIQNCPVCNCQAIYCNYNKVNIFNYNGAEIPFDEVEIPNIKHLDFECPTCGFVMTFNLEKLLR